MSLESGSSIGMFLIGHDGQPSPDDTRIIVINTPDTILAQHFNGFVIDGGGSIKVGDIVLSSGEAGPALSRLVQTVTDMVMADETITDKETYCQNLYTQPELLPLRNILLEAVVEDMRNNPDVAMP